ncbi:ubiquitin [Reticulomyxa filosa]|uniref:Ubiquitin n=1 Tax=Reticulomyxa filosa TaxID=46433 RepID=X6LST8_RETFI|nr:ubiquitin [Reticulomyxa filosa]|eukprot:ETO04416.1 ubiquitin [Reticulomyxa filosa]
MTKLKKKNVRKKAETDMKDMVEKEQMFLFKKPVDSLVVFDKLLEIRFKQKCYRVENLDVEKMKAQVAFKRQQQISSQQSGNEDEWGMMKIHDQFMQDFRTLSDKTQTVNAMALELDRGLLFNVTTCKYFDSFKDTIAERILVLRECHYTEPELQFEMVPYHFEEMLTSLERYYDLAKQDGEIIATETMDDDPFVPAQVDACYGVARFVLANNDIPTQPITLPILLTGTNDQVGTLVVEPSFTVTDGPISNTNTNAKAASLQALEGKKVKFTLEFLKCTLSQSARYCFISFVAVGADLVQFKCEPPADGARASEFEFSEAYEVRALKITKNFRSFIALEGIQFKVWVPVFDNPHDMPPIIASKYTSKNITIRIQAPDGEQLKLHCKTGNTITALKRKIDFQTNIPDDAQTLIYEKVTLENNRTLSDYNIEGNALLLLLVETKRRKSVDAEFHPEFKQKVKFDLGDIKADDLHDLVYNEDEDEDDANVPTPEQVQQVLVKELTNPDLSAEDRSKLRRAKNRSVHMVLMDQDSRRVLPMTMEGYQAENKKLKDTLRKAQERIEELQKQVAALESKLQPSSAPATNTAATTTAKRDKPKGGAKFFGAWRRNRQKTNEASGQ